MKIVKIVEKKYINSYDRKGDFMKKKVNVREVVFFVFLFLGLLLFSSVKWCQKTFGEIGFDQLLFTIKAPLNGTDNSSIFSWLLECLLLSIGICLVILVVSKLIKRLIKDEKLKIVLQKIKNYAWIVSVCFLLASLVLVESSYDVIGYYKQLSTNTDIYSNQDVQEELDNLDGNANIIYQEADDVKITGDNTNNLIYIYLESYENSFVDKANGGNSDINCLPELTKLAQDNLSFSHHNKIGGAQTISGSTWTIGSMVSQISGIPLKVEAANTMDQYDQFMPGAKMLGDVLEEHGYVQKLVVGSDSKFAGTDKLFKQHGNYEIVDLNVINSKYQISNSERCDWGLNDQGLIKVAKQELSQLASKGKKFNFTMATIDCHMPTGYKCNKCPKGYTNDYERIYACQSKQISEFVSWIQQQPWYQNTTIVLVGDHPTMVTDLKQINDPSYNRTTYNCIINSRITTHHSKNRLFTHLDMFPTTLAALGFNIEGNKLGLGTNLFSAVPTNVEKHSVKEIEKEIQKSAEYLDKNIYQLK